MEVKVITLEKRPDKLGAFKAMALQFGYWKHVEVCIAHDGGTYETGDALIEAMAAAGWTQESNWQWETIKNGVHTDKIPEYGIVNSKSHLGLRWTYLEVLRSISENTIVLLDDHYLCKSLPFYDKVANTLKTEKGKVLGLDPIVETPEAVAVGVPLLPGYHCPCEEAILWTPEGASTGIEYLMRHPEYIIGDVLRRFYPKTEVFTTPFKLAKHIGTKEDWVSDVHLGDA